MPWRQAAAEERSRSQREIDTLRLALDAKVEELSASMEECQQLKELAGVFQGDAVLAEARAVGAIDTLVCTVGAIEPRVHFSGTCRV